MPHLRTLRDIQFADREDDIRGATLYSVENEKLGKIDEVIFDHASGVIRHAVVDSSGWLSRRKFLVPADRVHNYEPDPNALQVDMVKKHVQRLPAFERSLLESEEDWRDYERHYREWVLTGDVIHRRESGNIVALGSEEVMEARKPSARWSRFQRGLSRQCRETSTACPECTRQRRAA